MRCYVPFATAYDFEDNSIILDKKNHITKELYQTSKN